jgi:multicomponent Na+:H+ antiporter subunit D
VPFTSGALAKFALKSSVLEVDWLVNLLPITAIGTTVLMLRFIDLVRHAGITATHESPVGRLSFLAHGTLLFLVIGIVYWLPQAEPFIDYAFSYEALWNALWPLLLGALIFLVSRPYLVNITPVPAGDFIVIVEKIHHLLQGLVNTLGHFAVGYVHSAGVYIGKINHISRGLGLRKTIMNHVQPGILVIGILVLVALTLGINEEIWID